MTKSRRLAIYRFCLATVAFAVLATAIILAVGPSTNTINIVASVLPERSIVVDRDLTIQKIYSNTSEDVRPSVYVSSIAGPPTVYSEAIAEQYQSLKSSLNFKQSGLIYERPGNSLSSIWRSVKSFFQRLLQF